MVTSWLRVAARGSRRWVCLGVALAGRHEGVKKVVVAGVFAGRRAPVGSAFGACGGFLSRRRTPCGPWVGATQDVAPPGVLGPWMERCLRDPRSVPRGGAVRGGLAACPVSGVGPPGPVPGWSVSAASLLARAAMSGGRLVGVLACWLPAWHVTLLDIPAQGCPRALRSAVGTGASFRCGHPSASSVAPATAFTVGSSRCGWAGSAGGAAASSFIGVNARVRPSGTGAGLGWLPMWPASARLLPLPSAGAGLAAGVPLSGYLTPVERPWPGVFARGASVVTVVRLQSPWGCRVSMCVASRWIALAHN